MPRRASGAAGKGTRISREGDRWQITGINRHDADDRAIYIGPCHINVLRRAIEVLARQIGQVTGRGSAKRSCTGGQKA